MAAISTTTYGDFRRSGAAQATTGQTDWINVPPGATHCFVFLNITATAGTTPLVDVSFLAADPVSRDDAHVIKLAEHADLTDNDGTAAQYIFQFGTGVTGIADDVTIAAGADSVASLNVVLPPLLGVKLTLDRTTGDETYTYNLSVTFRK